MALLIQRIRTVLSAAVTWLVLIGFALTQVAAELDEFAGVPPGVIQWVGSAIAIVGAIVAIIRRVTPVLEQARGLDPVPAGQAVTERERNLQLAWRSTGRTGSTADQASFTPVAPP